MTNLQNPQDLAPNYAGSIYGIINFVGITSGFITPLIVSYFTAEKVKIIKSKVTTDFQLKSNLLLIFLVARVLRRNGNGYL